VLSRVALVASIPLHGQGQARRRGRGSNFCEGSSSPTATPPMQRDAANHASGAQQWLGGPLPQIHTRAGNQASAWLRINPNALDSRRAKAGE